MYKCVTKYVYMHICKYTYTCELKTYKKYIYLYIYIYEFRYGTDTIMLFDSYWCQR